MFTEHTKNIHTATKLNITLQRYLLHIWQLKHPTTLHHRSKYYQFHVV